MKFSISILIVLFVLLMSLSPSLADIIYLKVGGEVQGQILSEDADELKVKVSLGVITFRREQVGDVKYEKEEIDHLRLGDDYLESKEFDAAIREYQKALQINSEFDEARRKIELAEGKKEKFGLERIERKKRLSKLTRIGLSFLEKGEYKKAIKRFNQARLINPQDGKIRDNLVKAHIKLAELCTLNGDCEGAIKEFKLAKQFVDKDNNIDKNLAELYLGQSRVYFEKGSYDKALKNLAKVIKLNPEESRAYILQGQIYDRRHKLNKAIMAWKKALNLDPENSEVQELLDTVRLEKKTVKDLELWKSEYFVIDFKGKQKEERKMVRRALATLEDAYEAIGADLHYFPEKKTRVTFYTKKQYQSLSGVPTWSVGLYRYNKEDILISLSGIKQVTNKQIKAILWHETTHMFIDSLVGNNCPTWLNEGMAEYEEAKIIKPMVEFVLKEALVKKKLHSLKRLERSFNNFNNEEATLAYAESYSLTEYIVAEYGRSDLRRIFKRLSRGKSIEEAIRLVLDVEYKDFENKWRRYLREKYSSE